MALFPSQWTPEWGGAPTLPPPSTLPSVLLPDFMEKEALGQRAPSPGPRLPCPPSIGLQAWVTVPEGSLLLCIWKTDIHARSWLCALRWPNRCDSIPSPRRGRALNLVPWCQPCMVLALCLLSGLLPGQGAGRRGQRPHLTDLDPPEGCAEGPRPSSHARPHRTLVQASYPKVRKFFWSHGNNTRVRVAPVGVGLEEVH